MLPKLGGKKAAAKGVNNKIRNRVLTHTDYKECLMNDIEMFHPDMKIQHKNHQLETSNNMKKSLSPYNDKKWIKKEEDNSFITYSFGHKKLKVSYFIKLLY